MQRVNHEQEKKSILLREKILLLYVWQGVHDNHGNLNLYDAALNLLANKLIRPLIEIED